MRTWRARKFARSRRTGCSSIPATKCAWCRCWIVFICSIRQPARRWRPDGVLKGSDMDKAELKLRESIVHACRSMNGLGINQGTSGNISARYGKLMLITPSGVPYDELKAKDIVTTPVSGKGDKWTGALAPSSEWRF